VKTCAHNPAQSEYSLCGVAFDAPETECDVQEFEFSNETGDKVTCEDCLRIIEELFESYTRKGRLKKNDRM